MGMEELTFEAYKRSYWDYFLVPEKRFAAASRPLRVIYDAIGSGNGRLHGA